MNYEILILKYEMAFPKYEITKKMNYYFVKMNYHFVIMKCVSYLQINIVKTKKNMCQGCHFRGTV